MGVSAPHRTETLGSTEFASERTVIPIEGGDEVLLDEETGEPITGEIEINSTSVIEHERELDTSDASVNEEVPSVTESMVDDNVTQPELQVVETLSTEPVSELLPTTKEAQDTKESERTPIGSYHFRDGELYITFQGEERPLREIVTDSMREWIDTAAIPALEQGVSLEPQRERVPEMDTPEQIAYSVTTYENGMVFFEITYIDRPVEEADDSFLEFDDDGVALIEETSDEERRDNDTSQAPGIVTTIPEPAIASEFLELALGAMHEVQTANDNLATSESVDRPETFENVVGITAEPVTTTLHEVVAGTNEQTLPIDLVEVSIERDEEVFYMAPAAHVEHPFAHDETETVEKPMGFTASAITTIEARPVAISTEESSALDKSSVRSIESVAVVELKPAISHGFEIEHKVVEIPTGTVVEPPVEPIAESETISTTETAHTVIELKADVPPAEQAIVVQPTLETASEAEAALITAESSHPTPEGPNEPAPAAERTAETTLQEQSQEVGQEQAFPPVVETRRQVDTATTEAAREVAAETTIENATHRTEGEQSIESSVDTTTTRRQETTTHQTEQAPTEFVAQARVEAFASQWAREFGATVVATTNESRIPSVETIETIDAPSVGAGALADSGRRSKRSSRTNAYRSASAAATMKAGA